MNKGSAKDVILIRGRQKISPDIVGTAHATETAAQLTLANKQNESNRKFSVLYLSPDLYNSVQRALTCFFLASYVHFYSIHTCAPSEVHGLGEPCLVFTYQQWYTIILSDPLVSSRKTRNLAMS